MNDPDKRVVTAFSAAVQAKQKPVVNHFQNEDIHIGPNTILSGGFKTHGVMIVDGKIDSADIAAERLVISHVGDLEGKVSVQRAEISGIFSGDLDAADEVIIRPTARVAGSVKCQKLIIHRGARIECSFSCNPEQMPVDGSGGGAVESNDRLAYSARRNSISAREKKAFVAGAGSVLALIGVVALLMILRMLLA